MKALDAMKKEGDRLENADYWRFVFNLKLGKDKRYTIGQVRQILKVLVHNGHVLRVCLMGDPFFRVKSPTYRDSELKFQHSEK